MIRFLAGSGRTWLLVVGAAMLPLLLVGGWVGYLSAVQARAVTARGVATAVNAAADRIAADLAAQLDLVRTLAASTALDGPDLPAFRTEAERVRAHQPLWHTIELALPSGAQVLNLLRPAGIALGATAEMPSLERVVATGQAVVGGIGPVGPVSGRRLVALRAPVMRGGKLTAVLSVALVPTGINTLLRGAGAPPEWIGAVLDGTGRIVARTRDATEDQGQLGGAELRRAVRRSPDGRLSGQTLEGVPVETAYRTLPGTDGWVVAFGIPRALLEAPVQRALLLLGVEGGAGLVLAALLTSLVARDLAQRRAGERASAEQRLRDSEQGRALAVEAAELGVWRWAIGPDAFDASDRCLGLLALPNGAVPLRWAAAMAAVHSADAPALADALGHCLRQGGRLDVEVRIVEEERLRWVRLTGRHLLPGSPGAMPSGATLQGVVADISQLKQAEADRLVLLRDMAAAQENDRRRIARELHDQVGQTVTGLSLGLKSMEARLGTEADGALRTQLAWLRSLAGTIGQDIHRAAADLRPTALDDLGLPAALRTLGGSFGERHGLSVDVQVRLPPGRLPAAAETVIYRVVQEGLTNVVKHANARTASVLLSRHGNEVRLIIEDDGRGFDPASSPAGPRLGLSGMRERLRLLGGAMEVETAPGAGTTLFARMPCADAAPPLAAAERA